ncbi:hypothetical protein HAX54_005249 [Datura stramonium]|uniref:Uncharacterized protein n=1 Tax=Datura stramonium TaxID=4076 RepID=A0ABS8T8E7_DATST|nr:hypothetical protein [Datura stramonium]
MRSSLKLKKLIPLLQQAPSSGKPPATQQSPDSNTSKSTSENFKDGRSKDRHDDERRKHVKKGGIRETNSKKRASEGHYSSGFSSLSVFNFLQSPIEMEEESIQFW